MKKLFYILILSFILTSCSATDVIGKSSKESFKKLYERNINSIGYKLETKRFVFSMPSKETFEWSTNFKNNKEDIVFNLDANPFLKAGLDINKLPEYIKFDSKNKRLIFNFDVSDNEIKFNDKDGAETFNDIIDKHRNLIGYHMELGHFGMALSDGYKIERAKDTQKNDKDLVFILDPNILKDLGVDINNVEGWTYTKMKEENKEVELLLKPFDLK